MRRLWPDPAERVDLAAAYPPPAPVAGRPSVRMGMITSLDGATAIAGVSGGLGGAADREVYLHLRALADVVLVGAGTLRAEGYGPPRLAPERQRERRGRGQAALPRIAVVSRSCRLDWGAPLFAGEGPRPIVVTAADAPAGRRADAARVADVVATGAGDVDLGAALRGLGALGARAVVAEGGPRLNGALAAAGLVDEVCLTVAPRLVGDDSARLLDGPAVAGRAGLRLLFAGERDGFLFLRYGVPPAPDRA